MSAEQVEQAFGRLEGQLKNNQRKKALKTTDEILRLAPGDADALRVKTVLHIELGSFDEALKAANEPAVAGALGFERAYCLYRQGKLQEALGELQHAGAERGRAAAELEAQLQYRQGHPGRAVEIYSQLLAQSAKGEAGVAELQINLLAAYVAAGRGAEVPGVMQAAKMSARDSFEVGFNAACGLIDAGQLADAEDALVLSRRVGEEALYEEELGEDEVAAELAPITAQLAYVAARLGRRDTATSGLESLLHLDLDDSATACVAANNLYALLLSEPSAGGAGAAGGAARKVAGEGLKRLEPFLERSGGALALKPALASRLGPAQREALLSTFATAALLASKPEVAKQAVAALELQAPSSLATPALRASLLARDGKPKEADEVLAAAAAAAGSDPARAAELLLLRAQLAGAGGDAAAALAALDGAAAAGLDARPAVLATRLALLEQLGRGEEAASALEAAVTRWQAAAAGPARSAALGWIVRQLAGLRLRAGDLDAAAERYRQLAALDPDALADPELAQRAARLAAATGGVPPPALAARLEAGAAGAGASADVDALESAGCAGRGGRAAEEPSVPVPASKKREAGGEEPKEAKRKRKKRRRRLPKGFDPANPGPPPDPERWLPKWQRSDARKQRKKMERRGKEVVKGSQGAGKVDDSLDRTNAPMVEDEPKAKSPVKPPPGAKGGKKKGKR